MKRIETTFVAGVIAAVAMAAVPAYAGGLKTSVGGVNVNVGGGSKTGVGVNVGGKSGVTADVGIDRDEGGTKAGVTATIGSGARSTTATVGAAIGNGNNAPAAHVNANVATGALGAQSLTGDIDVKLGTADETLRATVDLNGDGIIDTKDSASLVLDLNGDGLLSALDDVNLDGVLDQADLDVGGIVASLPVPEIIIGVETPLPGRTPGDGNDNPDGRDISLPGTGHEFPGSDPDRDVARLGDAARSIDDNEIAALKLKCADVLAAPAGFDAETVVICRTLARL